MPPSSLSAAIAISMKPACETDEYASRRLTLVLRERGEVADRERRDGEDGDRDRPDLGLLRERDHEHAQRDDERAALVAADMNAVTGVGAPS